MPRIRYLGSSIELAKRRGVLDRAHRGTRVRNIADCSLMSMMKSKLFIGVGRRQTPAGGRMRTQATGGEGWFPAAHDVGDDSLAETAQPGARRAGKVDVMTEPQPVPTA